MCEKNCSRFLVITFVIALVLTFTGISFAQVPADAKPLYGEDFIKKFDFDKDGKVNHDEWEGIKPMTYYANNRWPQFDKNRDGFITIDEAPKQK